VSRSRLLFFFLCLVVPWPLPAALPPDSPYFLAHEDDPVPWRVWGHEALAEARERGVPLLLVSGYFTCRWCRVMGEESFADLEVGQRLARGFVPVLLDRELDPALDRRLRRFMMRLHGRYGWPAVVVFTPEGHPFAGTLYRPREDFLRWLDQVGAAWRDSREALRREALAWAESETAPVVLGSLSPAEWRRLRHDWAQALEGRADPFEGGLGEGAKFPYPGWHGAMLAWYRREGDLEVADYLRRTLRAMAAGEIHDHLGGGFFRYAEFPDWSGPHYEKMLADNAVLARLYLQAGAVFDEPAWIEVARRTLAFLEREMRLDEGGYASALHAEDETGVEGGNYRFTPQELASLPLRLRGVLQRRWGLQGPFSVEGGWLPRPRRPQAGWDETDERLLALRGRAARDEKWLAADNALVLLAWLTAWERSGERDDLRRARSLARLLMVRLEHGRRPLHGLYRGRVVGRLDLEDLAFPAYALAHWARLTGDIAACRASRRLVARAYRDHFSPRGWLEGGGLPGAALVEAARPDRVRPSPSAWLIELGLDHGDASVRRAARRAQSLVVAVAQTPLWYPGSWRVAAAAKGLDCLSPEA